MGIPLDLERGRLIVDLSVPDEPRAVARYHGPFGDLFAAMTGGS